MPLITIYTENGHVEMRAAGIEPADAIKAMESCINELRGEGWRAPNLSDAKEPTARGIGVDIPDDEVSKAIHIPNADLGRPAYFDLKGKIEQLRLEISVLDHAATQRIEKLDKRTRACENCLGIPMGGRG
jgi:hypothetical protein